MRRARHKLFLALFVVAFAAGGVCSLAQAQTPGPLVLDLAANVGCYTPGGMVDVTVTFTNPADGEVLTSEGLEVTVPPILTYDSDVSGTLPDGSPDPGATGTLSWFTFTKSKFPAPGTSKSFVFRLAVAASAAGQADISGVGIYFTSGDELRTNVVLKSLNSCTVPHCPVAQDGTAQVMQGGSVPVTLVATDEDINDVLSYTVVAGPAHGGLSGTAPALTYTPDPAYCGPDSFTFKANDGTCDSNVATISIDVQCKPCVPPVAVPQSVTTPENAPITITLAATNTDDGPPTFLKKSDPSHGTASVTADGVATYTPNPDFIGTDSFTFAAQSPKGCEGPAATVTINVACVAPVVHDQAVTTPEGTPVSIVLNADDKGNGAGAAAAKAGGQRVVFLGMTQQLDLAFEVVTQPVHGKLTGTAPNLTYTPDKCFCGKDSFTFQAASGDCVSNLGTISITVTCVNQCPVANAGPDQPHVAVGAVVTLDGSASNDPDTCDTITYLWSFTSVPSGSTAALDSATAVKPTFTPDKKGDYVVQLVVNDGQCDSAADTVTVHADNRCPVANAGPDQPHVTVGAVVTLDGSASSDADGDTITYLWSFTSVPSGSTAALDDATAVKPKFTPDLVGDYVVQLVVNDGQCDSAPDTVTVHAEPVPVVPPLEISLKTPDGCVPAGGSFQVCVTFTNPAGGDRITALGLQLMVGDNLSFGAYVSGPTPATEPDPGDTGTLEWAWISGFPVAGGDPVTFCFTLNAAADATGDIGIDGVAPYFTSGDQLLSNEVSATVSICPRPCAQDPVADAGTDQSVVLGSNVSLNGLGTDPDASGLPLTYAWTFVSLPGCSALTNGDIVNSNAADAMFTPDCEGQYVLQLQVCKTVPADDCGGERTLCATDNVAITVTLPPTCFAFSDVTTMMQIDTADQHTTLDRMTRILTSTATVTIMNASSVTVEQPIQAVFPISAAGVDMPGATGKTAGGDFYFDLGLVQLAPGESTSVAIKFVYPYATRFTYQVQVWGNIPVPCP